MIPTNHPNTADCQMMIEGLAAVIGGIFDAAIASPVSPFLNYFDGNAFVRLWQ